MSHPHHSSSIYDSACILGLEQSYCSSRSAAVVSSCVISSGMAGSLRQRIYEGGRKAVYTATAAMMLQNLVPTYGYAADIVVSSGVTSSGLVISGSGAVVNLKVNSGGSTIDTTLLTSGKEIISKGGVATSTYISAGASQVVQSAGSATYTSIYDGGKQIISKNGVVDYTTVFDGGSQIVSSNANVSNTVVSTGGTQYLITGAEVHNTTIESGGTLQLQSNGKAHDVTQLSGGNINVNVQSNNLTFITGINQNGDTLSLLGGVATNFIINEGGYQNLASNASAINTIVNSGGSQVLTANSAWTSNTILSGGSQILSKGTAIETTINGGEQIVSSGTAASGTILSGGTQTVNGGTIDGLTATGGSQVILAGTVSGASFNQGTQIISGGTVTDTALTSATQTINGGTVTGTLLNSGASQEISGGTVTSTNVTSATQTIFDGTVTSTVLNSGGSQIISGGTVGDTTLGAGAAQYINQNASATNTTIASGGEQILSAGAIANATTVLAGGIQTVNVGGSSIDITQSNGGTINAIVKGDDSTYIAGTNANGEDFSLSNGHASNFILYQNGIQIVESGGQASGTIINAGAAQSIYENGIATAAIVNEDGLQEIAAGGRANATDIQTGGTQIIYNSGIASAALVRDGGSQVVSNGGSALLTGIAAGGSQVVLAGGIANGTQVSAGGEQVLEGASVSDTTVNGGMQTLISNATATSTVLLSGGFQNVSNGTANGTIVSNGTQTIFANGTANNAVVHENGTQLVSAGSVSGTILSGGSQTVFTGASAANTTMSAGTQTVSGGTVNGLTATGGSQVLVAGVVTNASFNQANQLVSGGTVNSTTLTSATQTITDGTVNGMVLNNASQIISSGTVNNATFNAGEQIVSGGTVTSTTLTDATQTVTGGTVSATVLSGGNQVISGGNVNDTTLTDATQTITDGTVSGTILSGGSQVISGGTVNDTTLSSASLSLYAGAAVNDINAQQATIQVYADQSLGGLTTLDQADVHFMHAGSFKTLQVDNLTANNATVHMNVDLEAQTGDQLQINSSYTGNALLQLTNTAATAQQTTNDGIQLVKFDSAATVGGTFGLPGGKYEAGAYEYVLEQGTKSGEGKDYYLRNSQQYNPTFKTMLNMPIMNVVIAQTGMNSLQKRLGDLHNMDNTSKKQGVWVRSYYRDVTIDDLTKTDMKLFGAEAGYDWLFRADEPTKLYAGVLIGYVNANTVESHRKDNSYHKGDGQSPSVGVYATLVNDERWFVDLAARNFWTKLDMKSHNSGGTEIEYKPSRNVTAVSLEGGKSFVNRLSSKTSIRIEPKLEFQYLNAASGDANVTNGTGKLTYDHADYLNGKAAVLLGYNIERSNGLLVEPLLELAYRYDFSGKNDITYAGTTEKSDLHGGSFEINAGLDMQFTKNLYGYAQGAYEKGSKIEGWGVYAGIRYKFGADSKAAQAAAIAQAGMVLQEASLEQLGKAAVTDAIPEEVAHSLFKFDRYTLEGAEKEQVLKFAEEYLKEKNQQDILIEGYTCDIGPAAYNQKLSERRANYVKKLLVSKGVPEDKITIKAYGSSQFAKKGFGSRKDYRRAVISLYLQ